MHGVDAAARALGIFCGLLLLALFAVALVLALRPMVRERRLWLTFGVLAALAMVKFALLPLLPGNVNDLMQFEAWAKAMAQSGPAHIYDPQYACKYTPAYLYALWPAAAMASNSAGGLRIAVEIPLIVADFLLALTAYAAAHKVAPARFALPSSMLVAFNPALIYASTCWGQNDAAIAFPVLLAAVTAADSNFALAWAIAVVGALIKAQGLMLLPILGWWTLVTGTPRDWMKSAGAGIAAALVVIAPFQLAQPWHFLWDVYASSLGWFPWASLNAFNLMLALGGLIVVDRNKVFGPVSFFVLGNSLFAMVYVAAAWIAWRRRTPWGLLFTVFLVYLGMFDFLPRMHERYLYYGVALLAPLVFSSWTAMSLYAILSATLFLDMAYVFLRMVRVKGIIEGHLIIGAGGRFAISIVNVAAFAVALAYGLAIARREGTAARSQDASQPGSTPRLANDSSSSGG